MTTQNIPSPVWTISEGGKNGTVRLTQNALVRTIKKFVGPDDRQIIPLRMIAAVQHDRKFVGRDEVMVTTAGATYVWKVKHDAEGFTNSLQLAMMEESSR